MKDTSEYSIIYRLGKRTIYVHRDECHYSFLLEDDDYTEVIVSKHEMDDSFDFPSADELNWVGQFKLLFGNYDGYDCFIQYCEENGIATRTYSWSQTT